MYQENSAFLVLYSNKRCIFAEGKHAIVAQLVEHWLPKPRVAGSSPVYRSRPAMNTNLHPHTTFSPQHSKAIQKKVLPLPSVSPIWLSGQRNAFVMRGSGVRVPLSAQDKKREEHSSLFSFVMLSTAKIWLEKVSLDTSQFIQG